MRFELGPDLDFSKNPWQLQRDFKGSAPWVVGLLELLAQVWIHHDFGWEQVTGCCETLEDRLLNILSKPNVLAQVVRRAERIVDAIFNNDMHHHGGCPCLSADA